MPGGIEAPIARPSTDLKRGDSNTVDSSSTNILSAFLNDAGGLSGGVADEDFVLFGRVALYAGGTGEVRFKDVSLKDLQPRVTQPETVSPRFRMQALNEFYYSWSPTVPDINKDGALDIVAGPYYYLGPDYNVARDIYLPRRLTRARSTFNGVQLTYDFTGEGWPDVIKRVFHAADDPLRQSGGPVAALGQLTVTDNLSSEIALLKDTDGDGKLEYIFKDSNNQIVSATPDPANPTGAWVKRPLTERGPWTNHGIGIGDVNKDGRVDLVNGYGWWEQPATGTSGPWKYLPAAFGKWSRSSPGGAEIAVYDVNATA